MPQMAPLSWIPMTSIFLMIIVITSAMIYTKIENFSMMKKTEQNMFNKNLSNSIWKW